jgi:hypothetical protein
MGAMLAIVEGTPLGLVRGSVCRHADLQATKDALTVRPQRASTVREVTTSSAATVA